MDELGGRGTPPSPRCELFAFYTRLALWGTTAVDTMSEDDRRLLAQVWERLDDLFDELDEDDRRWLGIPANKPSGARWYEGWPS